MEAIEVLEISREAIIVLLKIALPLMLVALGVGLVISLFQALTQIQEQTLSFVPKIVTIFLAAMTLMPFIAQTLGDFTVTLFSRMTGL